MKAETYPLKSIFGKDVQYAVPLYQRPYVWRQVTHWEPLWEDVEGVATQLLLNPGGDGERNTAPHFLGAVVLDQQRTQAGSIEQRHIIDGQQRFTTLQLLLAAGSKVAENRGFDRQARIMRKLVANDPDFVTDRDDQFKVWPTNVDREAFRLAMESPGDASETPDDPFNLVQEAHTYFYGCIESWLGQSDDEGAGHETRLQALADALRDLVQIVVIDLEPRDNAQVIFETLNARGTPLLAIDLVKNVLFLRIQKDGAAVEELYRSKWRQFERAYWREEVRQGRLKRARAELFLMHWLAMETGNDVAAHQLYNTFRKLPELEAGPADLLGRFSADGEVFRSFDHQVPGTPEARFFESLTALDTNVVLPVVLFLMRQPSEVLNVEARRLALAILESWLVRRMLCGLTPKNYNRYMLEILREIKSEPHRAPELILEKLRSASSGTNLWPGDEQLRQALVSLPFYKRLAQARIRLVLAALERFLRTSKAEEVPLPSDLTIEHVMPQQWRMHWPTTPPDDLALGLERDAHIHRLGNLTLVTARLNPALSNSAWSEKRDALNEHSVLLLNRHIADRNPLIWNEDTIDARSEELARHVAQIWPGPEADWTVDERTLQLQSDDFSVEDRALLPAPEELLANQSTDVARKVMEPFLDEISFWEDVHIWVGKAAKDEWRWIYFARKGSPFGAFCQLQPRQARARFRLSLEDVPTPRRAEGLQGAGPYQVAISLENPDAFGEALNLARVAYDQAVRFLQEE